jgi:L-amino acid N-acyltransferase YncA
MAMSILIAQMQPPDWNRVREVYLQGVAGGQATFETEAPSWEIWNASHLACARLVAKEQGQIVGWAALSPVSARRAYEGVAETSVYVATDQRGSGVGCQLLAGLVSESEQNRIWTLQAVMFPENQASVALHKACGFREVGRRERISKLNGEWRNTVLFERRSPLVGID